MRSFQKDELIDQFCGSGGLLIGAKRLGWDVVRIDMGKNYCDTARKRLSELNLDEVFFG